MNTKPKKKVAHSLTIQGLSVTAGGVIINALLVLTTPENLQKGSACINSFNPDAGQKFNALISLAPMIVGVLMAAKGRLRQGDLKP